MKVKFGIAVSQLSGKAGGVVASRNRYGPYFRRLSHPTVATSTYAMEAKARFAIASQAWAGLDDAERVAWASWAANNPIVDRLGDRRVLQANAAFTQINARRFAFGDAQLDTPPAADTPSPLGSLSLVGDIGAGDFEVAFTATPLGTGLKVVLRGALVTEGESEYIENKLKLVMLSAAAATSPIDWQSAFTLRFGSLAVGQHVFCEAQVYDTATGLVSLPQRADVVIVSTGP